MTVAAYALAAVLNLFVVYIGVNFLLRPYVAAAGYGVPAMKDHAYLMIKGSRDATLGVIGLVLLVLAGAHAEAWFMLTATLIPFGDAVIVLRHGGTKAVAFGVHFATAVVMLVSAGLLFAA
ncbi:DUF4267 domain-containing protein [Promicromonospora sp. NPDC057138]|uniref:DUF4267 domain-containing protein n=1 Tax=Promicromonospora sp. NPDC057138 TaxID=3346031 RepID=UPI003630AEA7